VTAPDPCLPANRCGQLSPFDAADCLALLITRHGPRAQLAKAAGLSEVAVKNLERGRTDPRASTLTAIQEAFDHAGVVFLDPGDTRNGGSGVRL
jgi:transcriptional regulator with XRE-family HTH domain